MNYLFLIVGEKKYLVPKNLKKVGMVLFRVVEIRDVSKVHIHG